MKTLIAIVLLLAPAAVGQDKALLDRAEKGDAAAQDGLGHIYSQGQGVPQDFTKAVRWWRKAADQGHADAQFNLGVM
ncbi:MAG: tetratricopeptide repeat protein, partial [Candidatus Solibacter sp.]|nr:tetratricopeptide repeat protein [Candidatus Solibacter sp.]